jgi:hypothetical protein
MARLLVVAAACLLAMGCSSRQELHPALLIEDRDIERAVRRGKMLIATGEDPYNAFGRGLQDANVRVSPDVIIRGASICYPVEEIAFHIACGGDDSDRGVHQTLEQAMRKLQREIRFFALLQLPKARDPSTVQFALRAGSGGEYPALVIEEPIYDRDVSSTFDARAVPSALYYFTVHFPVRGGPGVPPIGPSVRHLSLVIRDGSSEGSVSFQLPTPRR